MKSLIKKWLKESGLLYRIQYHPYYREWKNKGISKTLWDLNQFYNQLFKDSKPQLIFDIGANVGDHSMLFSSLAKKVIAVEPDSTNLMILADRLRNRKNVEILNVAIAEAPGESYLNVISEGNPFNSLSEKWMKVLADEKYSRFDGTNKTDKKVKVSTLTLQNLFQKYGTPDFIKIDVEGFEWQVLSCLDRKIPVLSFECNLPEFKEETCLILKKLSEINPYANYNYIRDDSWELINFVDAESMIAIVNSGKVRFMEIYCSNK